MQLSDLVGLFKAVLPVFSAVFVAVSGYLHGYPVMIIFLCVLAAIAFTGIALASLSYWRRNSSPRFKLKYHFMQALIDLSEDGKTIKKFQPMINFQNLASFQISYRITKYDWKLVNRVPEVIADPADARGVLDPLTIGTYRSGAADLIGLDQTKKMEGTMHVVAMYGLPNKESIPWEKKFKIEVDRVSDNSAMGYGQFSVIFYDA